MISFYPGYFGWLGNQMFQYAATFAASKRMGVDCGFPENSPNLFELFLLSAKKTNETQPSVYAEPHFHYAEIPQLDNLTLHGYFQSEKYFKEFRDEIKSEFTLRSPKYSKELDQEYIALHVRRGDYLNHPNIHPTCPEKYYRDALDLLPEKPVKIFSDDYGWCAETFKGDRFSVSTQDFIDDFELMSKCSYHITANSSFSWWAAWLSDSKKIIAPSKWFGSDANLDDADIIPDWWVKV